MKFELKKELPLMAIALLPFLYLMTIWKNLPEQIPTHWNVDLQVDAWGNKNSIWFMLFILPVFSYILMTIVPNIDPKKKIDLMGRKFYQLKFILVGSMSVMAIIILYTIKNQSISSICLLFVPIGVLIILLGNYFKTIQPNYFIGIKTPWTLENEEVWKSTHTLAGKMWVIGGLLILISSFIFDKNLARYVFFSIITFITIIPIAYSYIKSKELKNR